MKYLIVGLGNIGHKYDNTRHNIGFEIVDFLATKYNANWNPDKLGFVSRFKYKNRSVHLLKPNTFMNLSGRSVQYWLKKLKIPHTNLLIVVDDLNIDFAKIIFKSKGSDGGHNGLKSINETIGQSYPRLRCGIGRDFTLGQQVNYVLGKWDSVQIKKLESFVEHASKAALSFVSIGLKFTMDKYNRTSPS